MNFELMLLGNLTFAKSSIVNLTGHLLYYLLRTKTADYNFKFIETVDQQLLKGGVHLAGLLNEIFK